MLKSEPWWRSFDVGQRLRDVPVCERHEQEFLMWCGPEATISRGYELYPQGADA
jgi:hypothetical protein